MTEQRKRPIANPGMSSEEADEALEETICHANDLTQDDLDRLIKESPKEREHIDAAIDECGELVNRLRDSAFVKRLADQSGDESQLDRRIVIGQLELLELIGKGGMGEVWKARHMRLGKIQAVKILRSNRAESDDAINRFRREMRAIGQLSHPNIVAAQHADEEDDTPYLVMDFVDGQSLAELVEEYRRDNNKIPIKTACSWLRQAAIAIEYAHKHGIIHRDLKPGNLMVDKDGTVKVLDLGLSRVIDEYNGSQEPLTLENQILGTPDYMAPEQLSGSHGVDHLCDIYGLAATLYKVLCGQVCFPTDGSASLLEKAMKITQAPPPQIRKVREDIPVGLEQLLCRCLSKDAQERPQSAAEFAALLSDWSSTAGDVDQVDAPIDSVAPLTEDSGRDGWPRSRMLVTAAGFLFPVVFLFGVIYKLSLPDGGELVINVDDPTVEVTVVAKQGTQVKQLEFNKNRANVFSLAYGNWELELRGVQADKFELSESSIAIKKGSKSVVMVDVVPTESANVIAASGEHEAGADQNGPSSSYQWQPGKDERSIPGLALQPASLSTWFRFNRIPLRPSYSMNDRWSFGRCHFDVDPRGKLWAYSTGREILVREIESGKVKSVFVGDVGTHWQNVQFSFDGEWLSGIDTFRQVVELRGRDGILLKRFSYQSSFGEANSQAMHQLKWLPDSQSILVWNTSKAVVFDLSGKELHAVRWPASDYQFPKPWHGVGLHEPTQSPLSWATSIHPSGRSVDFLFGSGAVMRWDLESGRLEESFKVSHAFHQWAGLAWCPDGEKLAVWCVDETDTGILIARTYDDDGNVLHEQPRNWNTATWSPSGKFLVTDTGLIVNDRLKATKQLERSISSRAAPFWETDDEIVFAQCDDNRSDRSGAIERFRPSGSVVATVNSPQPLGVFSASINSQGQPVTVHQKSSGDVLLKTWAASGEVERQQEIELDTNIINCDWSPSGRFVAFRGRGTHVVVDLITGHMDRADFSPEEEDRHVTAFGHKGGLIAYCDVLGKAIVVVDQDGEQHAKFVGGGYETHLAFSPNDRWLAWHLVAGEQSEFFLVDLTQRNLTPRNILKRKAIAVGKVSFSPDSKYLLYSSMSDADQTQLLLFDIESGKERTVPVSWNSSRAQQTIPWSPDSKQFFANGVFELASEGNLEHVLHRPEFEYSELAYFSVSNELIVGSHTDAGSELLFANTSLDSKTTSLSVELRQAGDARAQHGLLAAIVDDGTSFAVIDTTVGKIRWTGMAFDDDTTISLEPSGRILHGPDDLDNYILNVIGYDGGRTIPASEEEFESRAGASPQQATLQWLEDHDATLKLRNNTTEPSCDNIIGLRVSGSETGVPPGQLPNLEELELVSANVHTVPRTSHPEKLTALSLEGSGAVNLNGLERYRKLTNLNLSGTKISSRSGGTLREMGELQRLHLRGTAVDEFILLDLANLPRLKFLDIRGTAIPGSSLSAFREKLPNCKVQVD